MKKLFFTLALLVGSMATYAQSTVPSGCTMSVAPFEIKQGKSATFDINLESSARNDINTFQVYVNIPDGWGLSGATATTRTTGYTVDAVSDHGSATRFYVYGYHGQGHVLTETNGGIITLTLTAPASVTVGQKYTVTCDGAMLSNGGAELDVEDFEFEVTVVEDALDLYDDAEALPAASTETKVTIHRAFEGGKWNSFVAPFDISADQYKAAFGDDVQVAVFSDQDISDSDNAISIAFSTVTETEANQPVIIKPSANLDAVTFEGTIEVAPDDASVVVGKGKSRSYMYGVYVPTVIKGDAEEWEFPLYLTNNKFWYAPAAGVTMKGYRGYIAVVDNPTAYTDQYEVKMYIDEDLTAINGIDVNRTNEKVYTVDGKFVGKDVNFNRMQKGVYIVNGKKVIK